MVHFTKPLYGRLLTSLGCERHFCRIFYFSGPLVPHRAILRPRSRSNIGLLAPVGKRPHHFVTCFLPSLNDSENSGVQALQQWEEACGSDAVGEVGEVLAVVAQQQWSLRQQLTPATGPPPDVVFSSGC